MKRKTISVLLSLGLIAAMVTGCSSQGTEETAGTEPAQTETEEASDAEEAADSGEAAASDGASATAGVIWYNFADTFIANARQCLNNVAAADGTIEISDADSQNDIATQDNNLNNFITQKPKYLVINNINNPAADTIAATCTENGIVPIFANTTSPSDAAYEANPDLWYVSSVSEQSGENMGNSIVEYFNTHDNWDRNGNGKVDFILLQGMQTFSDTINRSSYSLATIEAAGYELGTNIGGDDVTGVQGGDSINGVLCNFSRSEAQTNVEALIANYGDDIDCILADNDDEALGAIAALQAHGYFTADSNYIPVVGVDATVAGCEAINNGTLLGTSLNNPVKLAKAVYKVMYLLENGEEVTTESMGMDGVSVEGHKVLIDYIAISADNVDEASYDINDTNF